MTRARIAGALLAVAFMTVASAAQQPGGASSAPQGPAPSAPAGAAAPAQAPPVIFRTEVNYVEVDAVVTDAQGNLIPGLTQADFEILEDGKPQTVTAFSMIDLPIETAERPLFASAPIEPDVRSNTTSEGRIYLIVLDDLHTEFQRGPRVKAAMRRFIEERFGENDLAAIVYTGGRVSDSQDFTNNKRLLLASIDRFQGRKLRSATLNRLDLARPGQDGGGVVAGDDIEQLERGMRARNVMNAVRKLSEFMAGVRGRRKAMLLIGEGVDYDINQVMGVEGSTASVVLQDTRDAMAAATRSNVAIYAIDPRGLVTGTENMIESAFSLDDQGVGNASMRNELRLSQDSLRAIAAGTGGFAVLNQNDFDKAFERIVRENSSYYLLGYYSTNERRDGRFRRLQVRVKRPGLTVRARSGYAAARGRAPEVKAPGKDAPPAAIGEALGSPLPVTGVPMRVFAAPFKGAAPHAAVAIATEIDMSRFDYVEKNGTWTEQVHVVYSATDASGKVFPGEHHVVNLAMKPDTYRRMRERGLRAITQLNLPPGRYQLRLAAGNAGSRVGSVVYDLTVPNFSEGPLVLSGLALTSMAAPEMQTVRPKDPLADFLPGPFTATREFAQGDTITLFGEVYENLRNTQAHQVTITTELRADDGRVIRSSEEQRSSAELQGASGGYGFTSRVPLSDLAPGLYVIHVEAVSQAGERPTVSRDVQIRVRP